MITVVDYGMGNLRNVRRAFEEVGEKVLVTAGPDVIGGAEKIVLPGVGAFGEAVERIDRLGLRAPLLARAAEGTPLLGICLGMQLLFASSEESPGAKGLGLLEGSVVRFPPGQKVPHIGWNDVQPRGSSLLFDGTVGGCFYYVHSYYAPVSAITVATTTYGVTYSAAVAKRNLFGVQFHPEKSQDAGLALLRRFIEYRGEKKEEEKRGQR